MAAKPKLAVWKFASCDGCQLSILDCEDELLDIAGAVDIAYFPEASREMVGGPYDVSLVEGSVTTPHDARRIQEVREQSSVLVTMGACATSGGIQALRNFTDVNDYIPVVYAHPEYINTLANSDPIEAHVKVDGAVQGCPPNRFQLMEVIAAALAGRRPNLPTNSVCLECKRKGNVCVMVAHGTPCMGPVTNTGCGALCPTYHRGCYACFGPMETPNTASLIGWWRGMGVREEDIVRSFRSFNGWRESFRDAGNEVEEGLTEETKRHLRAGAAL